MNTKAYLKLLEYSLKEGDIPQDLYDSTIAEIQKDGKMTKRVYSYYINELEKRRLFYADGTPFNPENSAKTDGTYIYKHTKNPFWYIGHAFFSTIFKFLGWIGGGIGYGIWRVKDAKKFKKLGACITLSNHVGYLDALITRRALGCRKQYIIAAPHNCKPTVGGAVLRAATVLPLPISFAGARPFNEMLEYVAKRKAAIHFYAEQSLWLHYRKPRPYKEGAFIYADRLDIPVVPMLYCFPEPKGLRKLFGMPKVVVRIADPLYVDRSLAPAKRKKDLCDRAYAAAVALYEDFYGVPMKYIDNDEPTDENSDDNNCAMPVGTDDCAAKDVSTDTQIVGDGAELQTPPKET